MKKNIIHTFYKKKRYQPEPLLKGDPLKTSNIKNLGVYSVNDEFLSNGEENQIISKSNGLIKKTDLIIVSDWMPWTNNKKNWQADGKFKKKYFVNAQLNSNNLWKS